MATSFDSFSPGLSPAPKKGMALNSNYLQFTDKAGDDFSSFAEQYLPELYEAEVERYGNRTIGGFLRMVGAEMPMSSDQVIWSEQNRLHVSYDNCSVGIDSTNNVNTINVSLPSGNVQADECAIKVHQIVVIQTAVGECSALVTEVGAANNASPSVAVVKVHPYGGQNLDDAISGLASGAACAVFVVGSEYEKGSNPDIATITPKFTQYDNKPIIIRDQFTVNGSDTAQIGWVEVATEDGTSGYYWYMKAESETRLRFEDYLEMTMMEAEKKAAGSQIGANKGGSEGLFAAIKDRGQVMDGFSGAGGGTGALADFDSILKQLDKEGSIEENMLFLDRDMALQIDDMLAEVNGSPAGFSSGGVGASFGLFNNEAEMALNLGFSGFRRGSYDFYKTDWKYLNDAATRGVYKMAPSTAGLTGAELIEGVLIPAGTSTVYDQIMGSNIRRPFLHVRYRASETEDRRMKSWMTGSVGGVATSALDAMQVHFLSERCLCAQATNNFLLFTK
jgi:hypothetical protein